MKLIRKLGTRKNKKGENYTSWGEFLCPNPKCDKIVERELSAGRKAKSCGCNQNLIDHGETNTRLYKIWKGIKQRCLNSKCNIYKNYGGRGITICEEWLEFTPFRDWALNNGYAKNLTIDRKDNDGNYEPNNCQWEIFLNNRRKQRRTKLTLEIANKIRIKYNSGYYTQKILAKEYDVSVCTINAIINFKVWL